MIKLFEKLQDWVSMKMEELCGRLSPKTQRILVFSLFFTFACSSLFIFGDALYRIGKNEGRKESLKIEHIDSVPLIINDSINPVKESGSIWKQKIMKG